MAMRGTGASNEHGSMAVEFGVMFPLIALLIAGAVWFGTMFSSYLALNQAAREAVRVYALTGDPVETETTAGAAYGGIGSVSVDTGIVVSGSLTGTCDPMSPGTPPENAGVLTSTTFDFPIAFMPFPDIDLQSQAVMRCGG